MNERIKKWLKENSMIVVLLGLFFIVPYFLRQVDETAAAFDAGILHSIILTCVVFSIFQACTWSIVKTIWPDIGWYFKYWFSHRFKHEDRGKQLKIALFIYFFILLSLVLIFVGIV